MEGIVVVSASKDVLTDGHTGLLGNKPEERKRLVQLALRNAQGAKVSFVLVDQPEETLELAECVHDKGLLEFYNCAWEEWTKDYKKYPNERMRRAFGDFGDTPPEQYGDRVPAFVCKFGFASRHDGVQDPCSILGKIAYYSVHTFTPIHESTLPTLKWDLAVSKRAVETLVKGDNRIVYSQIIHPGHHAGPSCFGGFCFLNHAAIAARLLQKQGKYKKIAIVDVDYHHGNGTMAVFWNDPTVFFASLHGDPNYEFPFTTGFAHQIGGPDAKGSTLNLPLPGGTQWQGYKVALQSVIERVREFGAEALVVSLGADTLADDPVTYPQSRFALKLEDFVEMGEMLLGKNSLNLPTIVIQEGGYLMDQVPQAVLNFLLRQKV